eukprot:TRINITY_DN21346_c0_g1_i1.p1 TRINITY_DN21346_c0_g1~~TRINITY_DN21346_c0_g1_i1.p1  ORF type:complete len:665 (+),score=95.70 TRINITY_DN21346_c0_g1_i1:133-1995(+)
MELAFVTGGRASRCFRPSDKFQGPQPGWVFKLGDRGLGYYLDWHNDNFEHEYKAAREHLTVDYLLVLAEGEKFDRLSQVLGEQPHLWQSKEEDGTSLLHWAALKGNANFIEKALHVGQLSADLLGPNRQTPLMWASARGHVAAMHALLMGKADLLSTDDQGASPIIYAIQHKQHTALLKLVAHGPVEKLMSAQDMEGRTAAHWACFLGDIEALNLLQKLGASLSHMDKTRNSLLHQSVLGAHAHMLDHLLEQGLDPELGNADGLTCMELVRNANDDNNKQIRGSLQKLYRPNGIDRHSLAEQGVTKVQKPQRLQSSKHMLFLMQKYGGILCWSMCFSMMFCEYLLDSRAEAWKRMPWASLAFESCLLATLILYSLVVFGGDPGKVQNPPQGQSQGLDAYLNLLRSGRTVEASRLCTYTWLLKDFRTTYDSWSRACIQEFDHFCFFTGCAIGRKNHRRFWFLVLVQPICLGWYLFLSFVIAQWRILGSINGFGDFFSWRLYWKLLVHAPTAAREYPFMVFASMVAASTFILSFMLLALQSAYICLNRTQQEDRNQESHTHLWIGTYLYSPFSKSESSNHWVQICYENCKDFFWYCERSKLGPDSTSELRALHKALKDAGAM